MAENNEKIGGNGATNPNMRPGMPGRPGMGSSSPLNIPRHGPTGMPGMPGGMPGIGAGQQNNQGENPEEQNEQPSPVQQAKQAAEEQAKTEAKKQVKKVILKVLPPILPYIGIGFVIFLAFYFLIIAPMLAISVKIEEFKQKVVETGNKIVNLFSGDGFIKSSDLVASQLNKARIAYEEDPDIDHEGEFDSDLLIATLQHNTFVSPEAYEENEEESKEDVYDPEEQESTFKYVDSGQSNSFYNTQRMFLGEADLKNHGDENRLIYQSVGYKIAWTCSVGSVETIGSYIDTAAKVLEVTVSRQIIGGNTNTELLPKLIRMIRDAVSSNQEGFDFIDYIKRQEGYEMFDTEQQLLIAKVFQNQMPSCSPIIEGETEQNRVPTPRVTMYMDYHNYFNYLSKVYIPTTAFECKKCPKNLSEDEKKSYIREAIEEIVSNRNALNSQKDKVNLLSINFDVDGSFKTAVSSTSGASGYLPVGTAGTGWKQGSGAPWSELELVDGKSDTKMRLIGCYITSIAIIMANSGTTINSDTFDPSVLAKTLKRNGGIDSGGGVSSHAWNDLAPYFAYDHWISYSSFEQFERDLAEDINNGYHAIIHVYKDAKGRGHHFVAVVGIENGKIIISDPGYYGPDGQPIGDRLFTLEDYRYAIRGPIVSGRVFIDKSKGGN